MYRQTLFNRFEHIIFPREEKRRLAVNLTPHPPSKMLHEPVTSSWPREEMEFVTWLLAQVGLDTYNYRSETLQRRLPACLGAVRALRGASSPTTEIMTGMSTFAHIIVKWGVDHWSAWFEDSPHVSSNGTDANDSIHGLMQIHELPDLAKVQIVTVDAGTADGQTEFRVPDIDRWRYSVGVSTN